MSHSYAVRITYAYEMIKLLMAVWAERCEKMAVYEHVGERTNKVHCHLVIEKSEIGKEQLKNIAAAGGVILKGNKLCSFKKYDGDQTAYVYMTKGVYDPKYLKVWTNEDATRWKKLWVGDKGHKTKDAEAYEDCYDELTFEVAWKYYQRDHPNQYSTDIKNMVSANDYQYRFIKTWARNYAFAKHNRVWNIQAINMYKMLVYTYVFRNNLSIPKDDPAFKNW